MCRPARVRGRFPRPWRPRGDRGQKRVEFTPFRYMSWAKDKRARVRFPLAMSGLPAPGPELLPLTAELLTLDEVDPYGPASLRAAIAEAYGVTADRVLLAGGTS